MAGNRRKNKAPRSRDTHLEEAWFKANRARQKKRRDLAKKARKANRRKR